MGLQVKNNYEELIYLGIFWFVFKITILQNNENKAICQEDFLCLVQKNKTKTTMLSLA